MKHHPRRHLPLLAAACLAAAALPATAAGTVNVSFIQPEMFSDAGTGLERDRALDSLSRVLQQLGQQHLASGDTLEIQVVDVDLAGRTDPFFARGSGRDLRVMKGQADWPRIKMRYTLARPGEPVATEEVQLADLNYLNDIAARSPRASEPLAFEKHMLGTWFDQRFGPAQVSSR